MAMIEQMNLSEANEKWKMNNSQKPNTFNNVEGLNEHDKNEVFYLNVASAFDIESTNYYDRKRDKKIPYLYAWALSLGDKKHIAIGRTIEEFVTLLEELQEYFKLGNYRRLIVYIHNLGFEYSFLKKYIGVIDVFGKKGQDTEPMSILTKYGIEFRDSLILSGLSLEKIAENLTNHTIQKMVGDLDYSKIRHSETPLSETEKTYIINDVLILLYYINEQKEMYGNRISRIPITNTSRVKRALQRNCLPSRDGDKDYRAKNYRDMMKNSMALTVDTYKISKRALQGGFVYANPNYSNKTVSDVHSYDLNSSYPAVILSEKYPMGQFTEKKVESQEQLEYDIENSNFAYIITLKFHDLISKDGSFYFIPKSKSKGIEIQDVDNRVSYAKELELTITDVDYTIIKETYNFSKIEIIEVQRAYKKYLPKPFIEGILSLYEDKTNLKGNQEKLQEYAIKKAMLNSTYGMIVEDPTYSKNPEKLPDEVIEKSIKEYNDSKGRITYYPWGVFISAYARRNLLKIVKYLGDNFLYADTDSVKFKNPKKHTNLFPNFRVELEEKLKDMAEFHDIEPERFNPKGKLVGEWEKDGEYKRFKTLGAKKYLVETPDEEMNLTLSGLAKDSGIRYLQDISENNTEMFDNFNPLMSVPSMYEGKKIVQHIELEKEEVFEVTDYLGNTSTVRTYGGTHIEETDFDLSISLRMDKMLYEFARGNIQVNKIII